MKKEAAILLIFYSMVMLSYGALEMTHDLLHYLAAHHHTRLHDHHHDHHHHFNDHHHTTVDHSRHPEGGQMELPSLISSFIFMEGKPIFSFSASLTGKICHRSMLHLQAVDQYPLTPPPQEK